MRRLPQITLAAVLLSSTAAVAEDWPRTFESRFGTAVIEAPPERVVSLSYQNHDNFLALGVVPVGLRWWYGDYPRAVWPWAEAALGDAEPYVFRGEDISIAELAARVADVTGFAGDIVWDTSKPDGTPRKLLDVTRLRESGWQPNIGLPEGIASTYRWFLQDG